MSLRDVFVAGLWSNHPIFRMLLGMCPVLAVTTAADTAAWMGVAVIFVLIMSNLVISLIRNLIPKRIRIPTFIVVIASFVTVADLTLNAYQPVIHEQLGIFVPLIVVNCIILARAEGFASRNDFVPAVMDGLGMGVGFTLGLVVLGSVREILGAGTLFGLDVMPAAFEPAVAMLLPPGAFITLGFLVGLYNYLHRRGECAPGSL